MYNVFAFQQREYKAAVEQRKKDIEDWAEDYRQRTMKKNVENYEKRVHNFIEQMKESPIKCYDHLGEMKLHLYNKFRIEDEKKMIQPKIMRLRDWPGDTRSIRNGSQSNQHSPVGSRLERYEMDTTQKSLQSEDPFNPWKPHVFRQREKDKEIHRDMRFRAITQQQKVLDALRELGQGGLRTAEAPIDTFMKEHQEKKARKIKLGDVRMRSQSLTPALVPASAPDVRLSRLDPTAQFETQSNSNKQYAYEPTTVADDHGSSKRSSRRQIIQDQAIPSPKSILPVLHKKTHFKAATSIAVQQKSLMSSFQNEEDQIVKLRDAIASQQYGYLKDDAQRILKSCNVYRSKNEKVKSLRYDRSHNASGDFSSNSVSQDALHIQ